MSLLNRKNCGLILELSLFIIPGVMTGVKQNFDKRLKKIQIPTTVRRLVQNFYFLVPK